MIWTSRAIFVLGLFLAACSAPNFHPGAHIAISPSSAPVDDVRRLDELATRHDFVPKPLGRDRVDTADGPVSLLRGYEFRHRQTLKLVIGRELRHDRYVVFLEDIAHGRFDLRGLECRKYLEIAADLTAVFGTDRVSPSTPEKCDPTAASD
jgi:hypothetical protein